MLEPANSPVKERKIMSWTMFLERAWKSEPNDELSPKNIPKQEPKSERIKNIFLP